MENVKIYFRKNAEQVFALTLLLTILGINYLVPYKLVFLSIYFLIIVLGIYYLEPRKAALGAVLAALLVIIHVYYYPSYFTPSFTNLELWMTVLTWCSFLILTGAVMAKRTINLQSDVEQLKEENLVLQHQLISGFRAWRKAQQAEGLSTKDKTVSQPESRSSGLLVEDELPTISPTRGYPTVVNEK